MTEGPDRVFRTVALQRAASPEQLDHLVAITKPVDWIATFVLCLVLAAALLWSIIGRVPTRASGEGILVGGGRVTDAVSAAAGRLAAIDVSVGDHVSRGQLIAKIDQTDIRRRYKSAIEVFQERQHAYAVLAANVESELAVKRKNFAKLEGALDRVIKATDQRIDDLTVDVRNLQNLLARGYTTRKNFEDRRLELVQTQQRKEDARNEILKLRSQETDLETQREHDLQQSQFSLNDARRQMDEISGTLNQNSQVVSPIGGRVLEVKVSPGSVLSVGMPIASIEDEGGTLQAIVYMSAGRGKEIKPGMQVHLAPSTVKREEFGTMLGRVMAVSEFPMTPQGMNAVLHNDSLVKRFSQNGAPYAATVSLEHDPTTFSGYRWAVGKGPPVRLSSGTLIQADITTRMQRPLDLVLPLIKRLTGIDG